MATNPWELDRIDGGPGRPGPLLLVVLDGVGIGKGDEGDAVALARTPTLDRLLAECPHASLRAHGTAVGMPSDKDMGNSEVGHNALGCGRVFDQGAKLVDRAIDSGVIFEGEVWRESVARGLSGGTIHFIGLLSDGNVHSHIDHLAALTREADRAGVASVRIHPLLDGRDVGETSAFEYVDALEAVLEEISGRDDRNYRVASGGGRMVVTMDRYEADWSIVERGWNAHVHGLGRRFGSVREAVLTYRDEQPGITDQFLPEFVIEDDSGPIGRIEDGDAVIFVNFRGDRAMEISRAFEQEDFVHFDRGRRPDVLFAGMMEYDGDLHIPSRFLVTPPAIDRTLGEYLAWNGIRQLAVAETQKYGHVTYFWNGNCTGLFDPASGRYAEVPAEVVDHGTRVTRERRSSLETHIEIKSDRIPFEERPWMKSAEVTDAVIGELLTGDYGFARVNYANGDMVGHTGHLDATIAAVSAVDLALTRLLRTVSDLDGLAVITADHGNADEMFMIDKKTGEFVRTETGGRKAKTSHTLNPVPFILFDPRGPGALKLDESVESPGLANVAATALALMGFGAPEGYLPSLV